MVKKPFTSESDRQVVLPSGRTPKSIWDVAAKDNRGITVRNAFPRSPFHHLIPRELLSIPHIARTLNEAKINIDDYAVQLSEGDHTAIHTMGYNAKWIAYFDSNINPSRAMILAQMAKMKVDYKITEHTVPFPKNNS